MQTIDDIKKINLKHREILDKIMVWVPEREAVVISGARRVGKTYLMYLIAREIGKDIYYFDLEEPDDFEIVSAGADTLSKFVTKGYVFIDEIQYLKEFPKFIKLIVDHYPNIKLFCSGSSNLSIAKGYSDLLVGRTVEFELLPLSFEEFLQFKGEKKLINLLSEKYFKQINILSKMFNEFLLFGGYPEVALLNSREKKIDYISNIFRVYAKRDIKSLFEVNREIAFERFFHILSNSVGSLLNLSAISSDLGISPKTLERYLNILSDLCLVKILPPFSRNIRTEIRKAKKVYFIDTGLLNWAKGSFLDVSKRGDVGMLAENLAYISVLRKIKNFEKLFYWRKKSGAEVDFVVSNSTVTPIECKYEGNIKLGKGFYSFLKQYSPKNAVVLTKNLLERKELGNGTIINFIPLMLFDGVTKKNFSGEH